MHRFSFVSSHHNLRLHKNLLHSASSYSFSNFFAQGQPRQTISLNIPRYRKAVYSALWVQVTLVLCYLPHGIVFILAVQRGISLSVHLALRWTLTLVYLNSSLNPLLYCWKIREVRQAVKGILRQVFCWSSWFSLLSSRYIPPWKTCFQGEILPCWYRTIFNCKYIVLQAYLTEFKGISPSCFFRDKYIILGIEVQKCCQLNYLVAWGVNIPRELNLRIES